MTNKQLLILIAATTMLALVLAWAIERAQVRQFMAEFEDWRTKTLGGKDGD